MMRRYLTRIRTDDEMVLDEQIEMFGPELLLFSDKENGVSIAAMPLQPHVECPKFYRVAFAYCSPQDDFNAERGLVLACGRLDEGEACILPRATLFGRIVV